MRCVDVSTAAEQKPVSLQLVGRVKAGEVFTGTLKPGECVRIFTGSALPQGADSVVMQEDVRWDDADPGSPKILCSVQPWENVRLKGEDIRTGAMAVPAGERLKVGQLALLAALGVRDVLLRRRPVVGILATGNELREPSENLRPGEIYESNRIMLAALAAQAGASARLYPLIPDDLPKTVQALSLALNECDLLVTTGGVSVGEMDFVKAAYQELGGSLDFWRVAMKPGKPFALGQSHGKLLFGLPGNPVSAFVTGMLLLVPALLKYQGATVPFPPSFRAELSTVLSNPSDRRHFVRVRLAPAGTVESAGAQSSHLLHSLAAADGLVNVPPRTTLPPGAWVSVLGWLA